MFNTLGSFSAVYFTLAAILFILVLFEKHFIRLEDKIRADRAKSKKAVKKTAAKKTSGKASQTAFRNCADKRTSNTTIRKIPNTAA